MNISTIDEVVVVHISQWPINNNWDECIWERFDLNHTCGGNIIQICLVLSRQRVPHSVVVNT